MEQLISAILECYMFVNTRKGILYVTLLLIFCVAATFLLVGYFSK